MSQSRTTYPESIGAIRDHVVTGGPLQGARAMLFSTGGGVEFACLPDHSMDIGTLTVGGTPFGPTQGGAHIPKALSGFLVTCGLENVRQPADDLPLHGTLPHTPAKRMAFGERRDAPKPYLFAEATIYTPPTDHRFRLTRRIEAPIGARELTITDEVINVSASPVEMRILYHINFGPTVVSGGTSIGVSDVGRHSFDARDPALQTALCQTVQAGRVGKARLARAAKGASPLVGVDVVFERASLPFLQLWSDPMPERGIFAIEPTNCDRNPDGTSGPGTMIKPGGSWRADLTLKFDDPLGTGVADNGKC